jgi:hypothetical protein
VNFAGSTLEGAVRKVQASRLYRLA